MVSDWIDNGAANIFRDVADQGDPEAAFGNFGGWD